MDERKVVRLPRGTNLQRMSWQTLIDAFVDDLRTAEGKVHALGGGKAKSKEARVARRLALSRLLLMSRMKHMHESGKSDAKFLVELVRLLEDSDKLLGAYEEELGVWNEFLYVLLEKMKAERLVVYSKTPTGKEEFERARSDADAPQEMR